MEEARPLLWLLREAAAASRKQKRKSLPKRDYTEKEDLLVEAIRRFRNQLWIGNDPSEPGYYLIIGPKDFEGRKIALHFPIKKVKRYRLGHIIRGIDLDETRPT